MFNFFKKRKAADGEVVVAAASGELMPITDVKDDVFSTKMLGDGYAIKPSDGEIFAPVSGEVTTLFPTKHAIGIKTKEGLDVLIHLGLDTVELKGEPFTTDIKQGDEVKQGEKIATMDINKVTEAGFDDTVIVVYTNMDVLESVDPVEKGAVEHSQKAQTIHYK